MFKAWLEDDLYWIGGMTDMALLYFYQNYSGGGYSRYYFEAYNINGDPSVEIWNDDPNRAPFEPDSPEGPDDGMEDLEHTFTASTTDFEDHLMFYMFDWGDNTNNEWFGPYSSGEIVVQTHIWEDPGIYQVRVIAKDQYNRESDWSEPHTFNVIDNLPPTAPEMDGKKIASTGETYEITMRSSDPENQNVYYYIDWGDGVIEYWFGPKNSSEFVTFTHKFKQSGLIGITTKAKDSMDEISLESIFNVYVLKSRVRTNPFSLQLFNRIFEHFPILKQILLIL
jgi:hypothetical protein